MLGSYGVKTPPSKKWMTKQRPTHMALM